MNFSEFLMEVAYTYRNNTEWRFGQTCWNVFYILRPDANLIAPDPFHDDEKVPEFLAAVRDYLDD